MERIFATMRATYGASFDRQWECPAGFDPVTFGQNLKAHWGRELGGFHRNPQAIAYALENLPEHPPNLVQFRGLCSRRPEPASPVLAAPKADPERVAQILGRIARPAARDPRQWAREILDRHAAGDHVAKASLERARAAMRHPLTGAEK